MTLDSGEFEIGSAHADAVVDDADETATARLNRNVDAGCAGIECVFDKFLNGSRRPFDHFAGGDAIDENGIETADGHIAPLEPPHLRG